MIKKLTRTKVSEFLTSIRFSLLVVSVLFFFAWSDLIIHFGSLFANWFLFSEWFFIFAGLVIPTLLLIGAVQYKSRLVFAITVSIFTFTILTNLSSLPYYIQELNYEEEYGISRCSCCPLCEIKSIAKFVLIGASGIYLMQNKPLFNVFKWKRSYSLALILFVLIFYTMFRF